MFWLHKIGVIFCCKRAFNSEKLILNCREITLQQNKEEAEAETSVLFKWNLLYLPVANTQALKIKPPNPLPAKSSICQMCLQGELLLAWKTLRLGAFLLTYLHRSDHTGLGFSSVSVS